MAKIKMNLTMDEGTLSRLESMAKECGFSTTGNLVEYGLSMMRTYMEYTKQGYTMAFVKLEDGVIVSRDTKILAHDLGFEWKLRRKR